MDAVVKGLNLAYVLAALMLAGFAARAADTSTLLMWAGAVLAAAGLLALLQLAGVPVDPPGGPLGYGLVFTGLGVGALVFYGITDRDGLPVMGAVLVYLGAGWLVLALRRSNWLGPWRAPGLLGVGVLSLLLGMSLLPSRMSVGALLVALALALLLPVGLNLLSEDVRPVVGAWTLARKTTVTTAALAVAGGLDVAAALASHSSKACIIGFGVALLLITSIVSRTHLDTALALTLVALMSAAPVEVPAEEAPRNGSGQRALVALGDSYMSGEGAIRFFAGTDNAGEDECRRSPDAYAVEVGSQAAFDGLTFLACSGAITRDMLSGERATAKGQHKEPQIDQLRRLLVENPDFHPGLVLVSVGGNDAGFSRIGEACLAPGSCDEVAPTFERRLPEVEASIRQVYRQIRQLLPGVPIVAVPYPMPLADTKRCGQLALKESERRFIRAFLRQLNDTVKRAVAGLDNTYYVETMEASLANAHIQLCEPGAHKKPGINFVKLDGVNGLRGAAAERFNPQKWIHNSLHPNKAGHDAMAVTLTRWLEEHQLTASSARGEVHLKPIPDDTRGRDLAAVRTWELEQVRDLRGWVALLLVAAAGLWAAIRVPTA
jgi:lysophospholipase L1-like esterase